MKWLSSRWLHQIGATVMGMDVAVLPTGIAIGMAVIASAVGAAENTTAPRVQLRTAAEVRALSEAEAMQRHPAKLTGVVTLVFLRELLFVQDQTGGVIINGARNAARLKPGDLIEVEGHSDYGYMVPRVASTRWRKVGTASLPEPVRINSDDLGAGRHISEWVELEGVVRGASIGTDRRCMLRVDLGARVVEVQLVELERAQGSLDKARELVDARVRVRGVIAGYVNERQQLAGLYVRTVGLGAVEVLVPPPADVFALPETPVSALMLFSARGYSAHRVKLRGVVTGAQAGRAVYLREGGRCIVVFTEQAGELSPGDVAEVAGFPGMGPTSPRLHDAVFRRLSGGPPPEPLVPSREDLTRGLLDGELISIEAPLLNVARPPGELTLVLDCGGMTIQARFDPWAALESPWAAGGRLRVTGICRVERARLPIASITVAAGDIELWPRSMADIVVTQGAPWWTTTRLLVISAIAAAVALAALGWVLLLRRRVAEQTAIIREKIQNEAVEEERQRIAREFHDTLEQELAGLSVRLDALRVKVNETGSARFVESLQRLAHRLQDEARHFIWNLRERRWENTTLSEALADAVAERHSDHGVKIDFSTSGERQQLPGVLSHHVLRIGQEAVMNAVQHSGAANVQITLQYQTDNVTLTVNDDGCGFDIAQVTERRAGHFGITGMRERARRIGGKLELTSEPGRGTRLELRITPAGWTNLYA